MNSAHGAGEFHDVFKRMAGYYPGSTPTHAQRLVGTAVRNLGDAASSGRRRTISPRINLSGGKTAWSYPLKTLPRLTGRSGRVIVTEYALPRPQAQPHDAIVDKDGIVWFNDFEEMILGRLDPKTGQVREFPIPTLKPGYPVGVLDLESDSAGNLWIGLMYQAGVARFDRKTETFTTWTVPKDWQTDAAQTGMVEPRSADVDGKVWVKNSDGGQIMRLDPKTGAWENLGPSAARARSSRPMPSRPTAGTTSTCSTSARR